MGVLATVKVPAGFRVTFPKEVREILELKKGDEIVFFTVEGRRGRVCLRRG